jgi:hypothetical protein
MRKLTLVNHILKVRPNTLLSKDDITDHKVNEAYQKQFQSFDEYIASVHHVI